MKVSRKAIADVVEALFTAECYQVTKYLDSRTIVRATKPRSRSGKAWDKRNRQTAVLLTVGAPNYLERRFIAACRKAGEPFPVKKLQFRDFPKPR